MQICNFLIAICLFSDWHELYSNLKLNGLWAQNNKHLVIGSKRQEQIANLWFSLKNIISRGQQFSWYFFHHLGKTSFLKVIRNEPDS